MQIHCFQHVVYETPATILEWVQQHHHHVTYTNFYEERYSLPSLETFDGLLVMGGPMNVDEERQYPWLKEEKRFIRQCIEAGKKVLGICLGSQLVAAAAGGSVYPAKEKEIGFFPVVFSLEALRHPVFNHFIRTYVVFQWHGDTFHLPPDAVLIASSDTCPNQAFMIGDNVLGLQFHLEMDANTVETMIDRNRHGLRERSAHVQQEDEIRNGYHYLPHNKKDLFLLLDQFFGD
jgi:GMP synthase-like glutamine amidotransferase